MREKRTLKQIMAYLIVFVMVFSLVNNKMEKEVYADSGFEIKLSQMTPSNPTPGETFSFGAVDISAGAYASELITSIIISVSDGSISNPPTISASEGGCLTDDLSEHRTVTCYWNDGYGKTIDQIKELLSGIEYKYAEGMKITVTVDRNKTVMPTDKSKMTTIQFSQPISEYETEGTIHYYMFVQTVSDADLTNNNKNSPVYWDEAYNLAKSYYFMGMQGYLATITREEEDKVLDNITSYGAWAGGSRVEDTNTDSSHKEINFDSNSSDAYPVPPSANGCERSSWYWVDGPEAGNYINTYGTTGEYKDDISSSSTDSSKTDTNRYVQMHKGGKYGAESDTPTYSNWRRQGKSSNNQEPNNYKSGDGEFRLQVHFPDASNAKAEKMLTNKDGKVSGWNDLPNEGNSSGRVKGYFVEFSKYTKPDGSPSGTYSSDSTATVIIDVDHEHSWVTSVESSNPTEDPTLKDTLVLGCSECAEQHKLSVFAGNMDYSDTPYDALDIQDGITSFDSTYSTEVVYLGEDGTEYDIANPPVNSGKYQVIVKLFKDGVPVTCTDGSEAIAKKEFTINPKAVTITANPQTIKIGKDVSSETSDVSVSELCDGHSLSEITLTKDETNNLITPTDAKIVNGSGEDVSANYNITYTNGALTQEKRVITVDTNPTASGITYGDTLSDSSLSGGVVKDEEGTVITGQWEWVEDDSQKPGEITPSVADSQMRTFRAIFIPDNRDWYDPIVAEGIKLTVDKKKITIDWDYTDGQFTYNGQEQKPGATAVKPAGFPEGLLLPTVAVSVVDEDPTRRDGIDATPDGVSYIAKAELTGDNAGNYEIENTDNAKISYKIEKAALTVKLKNQDIKKKETIKQGPDQIESTTGLVPGDTVEEFTVKDNREDAQHPLVTGESIVIKNGSYDVTANYIVTYEPGTLTEQKIILDETNVIESPTATEITYGETIGDSDFSGGKVKYGNEEVEGTWAWDEPTKTPDAGDTGKYVIKFTPNEGDTYTPISIEITVKVKPKQINLTWGANEFTYNGKEQAPTAEFAQGEILQSDSEKVSLEVSGKKVDVNALASSIEEQDHYVATAAITGERASNYEIATEYRTKDFIIVPLELDNTNAEVLIGQDAEANPTVTGVSIVKDSSLGDLSGKKLTLSNPGTNDGDYTYEIRTNESSPFIEIVASFSGNYKGRATRTITKPKKTELKKGDQIVGEMEIFVMVDDSVDESLNPGIKRLDESPEAVLEEFLENFDDVTLVGGDSLKEKLEDPNNTDYVIFSDKYINLKETSEDTLVEDENNLIEDAQEELAKKSGKDVMIPLYLDLTMRQEYEIKKSDGSPVSGVVRSTNEPVSQVRQSEPIYTNEGEDVEISIDFPSELLRSGYRTYASILRIHNIVDEDSHQTGTYESTMLVDNKQVSVNDRQIKFTTNRFSTYVLMYTEEAIPAGGGKGSGKGTPMLLPGNDIPVFTEKSMEVSETTADVAPAVVNSIAVLPITPYTQPVEYVSPKTGDTNEIYVLAVIMAAGAGIALIELIKKKRKSVGK